MLNLSSVMPNFRPELVSGSASTLYTVLKGLTHKKNPSEFKIFLSKQMDFFCIKYV